MRHARITVLLGCALLAVALVGCDQERGGPRVVGEDGVRIDITATPTETGTATIVTPGEPAGTPTATTTATPQATETPSATPTGTPASTPIPSDSGGDASGPGLVGVPYSTSDVRAAVEDAGLTFQVDDEREPLCPDTSVPETVFWSAGSATDFGPNWALWVYPDEDARDDDWELDDGQLAATTDDCELPTGFNYFNSNVVMAFVSWESPGSESAFDPDRSPREHPALEAFLELGAVGEDDEGAEED